MKRIILIVFALLVIALTACKTTADIEPTEPSVRYSVTEVIDYDPYTYEVHYRTTYSNGIIIDRWTTVSAEEFERSVADEEHKAQT